MTLPFHFPLFIFGIQRAMTLVYSDASSNFKVLNLLPCVSLLYRSTITSVQYNAQLNLDLLQTCLDMPNWPPCDMFFKPIQ